MKALIFCSLLVAWTWAFPAGAKSRSWDCTADVEVGCYADRCSISRRGEAAPLALSFDESGRFLLGLSELHYEGKADVASFAPFVVLSKRGIRPVGEIYQNDKAEDLLLAFDSKDRVVMLKFGWLALPLRCKEADDAS